MHSQVHQVCISLPSFAVTWERVVSALMWPVFSEANDWESWGVLTSQLGASLLMCPLSVISSCCLLNILSDLDWAKMYSHVFELCIILGILS